MQKKYFIILSVVAVLLVAGLSFLFDHRGEPAKTATALDNRETNAPGLKIEVLQEGSGAGAEAGDTVTVNYVGVLADGTKFDSSIDRGTPFSFTLGAGSVIPGWDKGLSGMKVGEKRRLTIGPELGYGAAGAGGVIPPNATLIFEVEMLKIN